MSHANDSGSDFIANNVYTDIDYGKLVPGVFREEACNIRNRPLDWVTPATDAGWSRDVDDENTPCFMNEHAVGEYSYAMDWRELCQRHGISPVALDPVAVHTHLVSDLLVEYLMQQGEIVTRLHNDTNAWTRTDAFNGDLRDHPMLVAAEAALGTDLPAANM